MAITLDPTVGGASADSYVSAAEATAYFATRSNASTIASLTGDPLAQLLITATYRIDAENYRGKPSTTTQARKWPRTNVYNDGNVMDPAAIPQQVKFAQMEMALALAVSGATDLLGPTGTENIESVRAGSVAVQFRNLQRDSAAQGIGGRYNPFAPVPAWDPSITLPPQVFRLLRNWITTPFVRRQAGTFKIARGG